MGLSTVSEAPVCRAGPSPAGRWWRSCRPWGRCLPLAVALLLGSFAGTAAAITDADVAALRVALETTPTDASNLDERIAVAGDLLNALTARGEDVSAYAVVFQDRGRFERATGDLAAFYLTLHRFCWALVRHYETGLIDMGTRTGTGAAHPRLLLNAAGASRLRTPADAVHAAMLDVNALSVQEFAAEQPMSYDALVAAGGIDPWRTYGNNLVELAFRALNTGATADTAHAKRWLLAIVAYPHWGSGVDADRDLPAAHLLFGTALAYDWLHTELTPDEEELVRRKLTNQAAIMHAYARGYHPLWWADTWTQNHNPINNAGLALAGYALRGEMEEATEWIAQGRANATRVLAALDRIGDGSYHEGVPYWSYMLSYFLVHLSAIEHAEGIDLIGPSPWMRATLDFRLYAHIPADATVVNYADGPFVDYDGPQHLLRRLDARFRTGHGEWLARELTAARGATFFVRRRWIPFEYLWYDAGVPPVPPTDLPPSRLFPDLDLLIMRSGWTADDTVLTLKSGSPAGRSRFEDTVAQRPGAGTLNAGHDHPNQNAVTLFAHGAPLLSGPGYPRPKYTRQNNTLEVDHTGQVGEGRTWFDIAAALAADARGTIQQYFGTADYDYAVAEAAGAYPIESGVLQATRRVLFIKPALVLFVDHVTLDTPKPVHLVWRRYGERFRGRGSSVMAETPTGATLWLDVLQPNSVRIRRGWDTVAAGAPPFYFARVNPTTERRTNRLVSLATVRASRREGSARGKITVDGTDNVRVQIDDGGGTYTVGLTYASDAGPTSDEVRVVHVDRAGVLQEYFLGHGITLRDVNTGRLLIQAEQTPVTLQVRLVGTIAYVDAASAGTVSCYAPNATDVLLNGQPVSATRQGDYISLTLQAG